MSFAPTLKWQPVDRAAFAGWLASLPTDTALGMAGGYTLHPLALYLNDRDGGFWCLEVRRDGIRFFNRRAPGHQFHFQAGWALGFCWELKRPDAYRDVNAADCVAALECVP